LKSSNFIFFILGLVNKKQGPGSIRHSEGWCIFVSGEQKEGQFLVAYAKCGQGWQELRLWPNGTLMLTKYGMCVKPTGPVTDGVQVGKLVLKYISCYNVLTLNENKQT
jgi:hypothetical protein